MNRLCCIWICALLVVLAAPARADELRPGYLELTQRDAGHWDMIWKAPVLGGLATRSRPALPDFCNVTPGPVRLEGAALVASAVLTVPARSMARVSVSPVWNRVTPMHCCGLRRWIARFRLSG